MPNKENLRKWVAALRSGEFAQGQGGLHFKATDTKPERYCCLGVACLIAEQEGLKINRPGVNGYQWRNDGFLPSVVSDWLGVEDGIRGSAVHLGGDDYATTLNDGQRLPFPQIADRIEQHYDLKDGDADVPNS